MVALTIFISAYGLINLCRGFYQLLQGMNSFELTGPTWHIGSDLGGVDDLAGGRNAIPFEA